MFLQHTQQLDLRFGRELAHFVEEDSAAVGYFETSHPLVNGTGKRSLDVTE